MTSLSTSVANIIILILILLAAAILVVLTVNIVRLNKQVRGAKEQADTMAALASAVAMAEKLSQSAEVYADALNDVPAEAAEEAQEAQAQD